ncbi:glucuronate isomerase [Actibacterium mucosum KCTC 23349]|uniref:Uronate isomerase n=2 Tax=Actibacterium TaxID=1433986 RepID=A0A037ZD69_9RHOB|nr:glucuronate isomerase [Actibacterium mucosum KCTC 23349]
MLHPDRLLPADPQTRAIARDLLAGIVDLPLVCPHGHVPIEWFEADYRFPDPAELLIRPDHYVLRMFASQGFSYDQLGVSGGEPAVDARTAFRTFATHYDLFLGTPSRSWIDHALYENLGVTEELNENSADRVFDHIDAQLARPEFTPRALFTTMGIELLATTDSAVDDLARHAALAADPSFAGRIIPTFRPDSVTDPDHVAFAADIRKLSDLTGENIATWSGYLSALRNRRAVFAAHGATATDHGFATAQTANLDPATCQTLLDAALSGTATPDQAARFRAQMLTEMARMSAEDGMVMQIHAGSSRNHAPVIQSTYGLDKGFDMPTATNWTVALKPLLDQLGFAPNLRILLFTLDETTYARELAPMAGAYPVLRLGAPWWFFDSPAGMARYFDQVVETAGFANLAGFVDDTRALMSIPARHNVWRRATAGHLARMVAEHQLTMAQAARLAEDLSVTLARRAYKL